MQTSVMIVKRIITAVLISLKSDAYQSSSCYSQAYTKKLNKFLWLTSRHDIPSRSTYFMSNVYTDDIIDTSQTHRPAVVIVAGATGYIGKAVVEQSIHRHFTTIGLVRDKELLNTPEKKRLYGKTFYQAHLLQASVSNTTELQESISTFLTCHAIHSSTHNLYFVSCLASPVGTRREAYAIDYQATLNFLHVAQSIHAYHFCLLSAFCVRRPLLQLQQAKLKMEAEIQNQTQLNDRNNIPSWSIIRPTAFLKSISGQLESIQRGNSYVVFGDGAVTKCNPISQQDLAEFMFMIMMDPKKHNQIYNIGGPDNPLTPKMLGEKMFSSLGLTPKFTYAPTFVFDLVISLFQTLANWTHLESLEDSAEYARIGKYYAVEDMLTTRPEEKYGTITVQDHYNTIATQGQDPFTPIRATSVISRVSELTPLILVVAVTIIAYPMPHG